MSACGGESCSTVKGIPWLVMADGPAGLRLAKEYYEDGKGKHAVGNASMPDSIMEMLSGPMKLVMSLMGGNGKPKAGCEIKTQYCTAIPIGTRWRRALTRILCSGAATSSARRWSTSACICGLPRR